MVWPLILPWSNGEQLLGCGELVKALGYRSGAAVSRQCSGRNADSRAGAEKFNPSILPHQTVRELLKVPRVRSGGFRRLLLTKDGTIELQIRRTAMDRNVAMKLKSMG